MRANPVYQLTILAAAACFVAATVLVTISLAINAFSFLADYLNNVRVPMP